MPPTLEIVPVTRPIRGTVRTPGSKSLTNRALIVAALADGTSTLRGALDSQDTQVMIDSLRRLGIGVEHDPQECTITVQGSGGGPAIDKAELWLENSGTSIRYLTALCALGHGTYRLDGNARMQKRPIGDLVRALQQLGSNVECEQQTDCPPVTVNAQGLPGGRTDVSGGLSSQFLSALLMAAPAAQTPVEIGVAGELVSRPYIDMTLGVMARFGVMVDCRAEGSFTIAPQKYRAGDYDIEPDASAASYFFAAAAITEGEVTVNGLAHGALQGDIGFVEALEQMGCQVIWERDRTTVRGRPLRGIDIDMNAISDTAQTLAAVAVFADGPTRIRNVSHMRIKETDRIHALVEELRRIGTEIEEFDDGLIIHPRPVKPARIRTYDDHRMAMSFALVGLKSDGIVIEDPDCTAKTYPRFFDDLEELCKEAR